MTKVIKKIAAAVMAIAMVSSLATSASAENKKDVCEYDSANISNIIDISSNGDEIASTRDINLPKDLHDLSNKDYKGLFYALYNKKYTNTLYKFSTNTTEITISYELVAATNYTNRRNLTIRLYKTDKNSENWIFEDSYNTMFYPSETNHYKTFNDTYTFKNLSSDYYYYIQFYNSSSTSTTEPEEYSIACSEFIITD